MAEPVALDVDFVDYVRSEYLAGRGLQEIGEELGVSTGQAADALPYHTDREGRRSSFLMPSLREVAALLYAGYTRQEVATRRGVGPHCIAVQLSQIRAAGYRLDVPAAGPPVPGRPTCQGRPFVRRPPVLRTTTERGRALLLQGWPVCKMRRALGLTPGAASGIAFRLRAELKAKSAAGESSGAPAQHVSLFTPPKGDHHGAQV